MIPLFSATAVNAGLDLLGPIKRVIDRQWYVLGNEVSQFETEFADYIGVTDCIGVANGTDALELALRGLGVVAGDIVATVANAGFYSSTAIRQIGAIPLYVEIDEASLTMSSDSLAEMLPAKPKAVVVTHLYGRLADMDALSALCQVTGIPVLEDCAQAHGAQRHGKMAGSFGAAACFSFYPTKNLGALGDGGAVVTNDAELAAKIRCLRQYGWTQKYHVGLAGGRNSRLDEIQAAILREKLPHLDAWNTSRRRIANHYTTAFIGLPLQTPGFAAEDFVAHLYPIRTQNRQLLCDFLRDKGVATDIHYPVADHLQPAYQLIHAQLLSKLPSTEAACQEIVSLPCYPGMTDAEVDQVIAAVLAYFQQAERLSC